MKMRFFLLIAIIIATPLASIGAINSIKLIQGIDIATIIFISIFITLLFLFSVWIIIRQIVEAYICRNFIVRHAKKEIARKLSLANSKYIRTAQDYQLITKEIDKSYAKWGMKAPMEKWVKKSAYQMFI